MIIYPAIDLLDNQAVRLKKGDYKTAQAFFNDPLEAALKFKKQGAQFLHLVDLNGAKTNLNRQLESVNIETIKKIVKHSNLPIQLGGGIRSLDYIRELLDLGIDRVVLGSKAIHDKKFLSEACMTFEGKIVLALDIDRGKIKTQGWLKEAFIPLAEILSLATKYGVYRVIYTDIEKDGMLAGLDFIKLSSFAKACQIPVIASGGVTTLSDINKLASITNIEGVIIGKALYDNNFTLTAALMEVESGG